MALPRPRRVLLPILRPAIAFLDLLLAARRGTSHGRRVAPTRLVALLTVCALAGRSSATQSCFVTMAGGDVHTLVLRTDGTVWSWGDIA